MRIKRPFYERKSLTQMTPEEWESLCDGCGQCCVIQLQDDSTNEIWRTNVGCKLLDLKQVRCNDYANRHRRVPSCLKLTPDNVGALDWLPATCAYRLLDEGKPLPEWHRLRTGDDESVVRAGVSVKGRLVSERDVAEEDLEDHIIADAGRAR